MSDYSVIIKAQLEGFEQIESKLSALESKKIKLTFDSNVNDLLNDIKSQLNLAAKEGSNAGKQIGQQLKQGIESTKIDVSKYLKASNISGISAEIATLESSLKKISAPASELNKVKASIESTTKAFQQYKSAVSAYNSDPTDDNARALAKAFDEVTESAKNASNQMRELRAASSGIVDSKQLANFQKRVQQFYDSNTKMHKQYGQQVQNILTESMNSALSPSAFKNLQAQFAQAQKTISAEGLLGKGFFSEIKRGFEQIGQFVGTYGAWMQVVDVFRNMVTEVINVDSAMTELRKVSDASASEIDAYFSTAAENAKELGATISDVINSTADWTKLGYNLQDSAELARLTTLYQNIGDSMTQESAAESLVSTLQGFQLVPEEAEHIVDAFNEVGELVA